MDKFSVGDMAIYIGPSDCDITNGDQVTLDRPDVYQGMKVWFVDRLSINGEQVGAWEGWLKPIDDDNQFTDWFNDHIITDLKINQPETVDG